MKDNRKRYPTSISDVLSKTSRLKMKRRIPLFNLERSWIDITGDAVGRHSYPMRIIGTTLLVRVEHPSWMQELSYLKPKLLAKINDAIPAVKIKDIRFELGHLPDNKLHTEKADPIKFKEDLEKDELEFIERAAEQIPDEDIQAAAKKAMTRGFTRKKR